MARVGTGTPPEKKTINNRNNTVAHNNETLTVPQKIREIKYNWIVCIKDDIVDIRHI